MRKLCQNPIYLGRRKLRFEREQLPQVVDIRHFRMELMESLERANILRNQQVSRCSNHSDGRPFSPLTLTATKLESIRRMPLGWPEQRHRIHCYFNYVSSVVSNFRSTILIGELDERLTGGQPPNTPGLNQTRPNDPRTVPVVPKFVPRSSVRPTFAVYLSLVALPIPSQKRTPDGNWAAYSAAHAWRRGFV